ncbi:MAG: hypothetical protein ACM3XN_02625 [Chloroflexota bacterium]
MSRWTAVLANVSGVVMIAVATLVTAQLVPAGDIWRQTGIAFAVAGLLAPARRRILGRGPVFFDDFLRDMLVYLGIGAFTALGIVTAQRLIGGPVSPALPAVAVFLIGPSEGRHKRLWGVQT